MLPPSFIHTYLMTHEYTLYPYFHLYTHDISGKNFHKTNLSKFERNCFDTKRSHNLSFFFLTFYPLAVCLMNESMKQVGNVFMCHLLGYIKVKKN